MNYQFPRASGLLLPVSALPSPYGVGDLGPQALKFVDTLHDNKQHYWQMLPFGFSADQTGCPYSCFSAFGYYPLLISPENLVSDGLIDGQDILSCQNDLSQRAELKVDYSKVAKAKEPLFRKAYQTFKAGNRKLDHEWSQFLETSKIWGFDFSLFLTLTVEFGDNWTLWPSPLRDHEEEALKKYRDNNKEEINYHLFLQFLFYRQWNQLRAYAATKNIQLIGDLPIFVAHHSMDVWKDPSTFKLGENGQLLLETGAPPDEFNDLGQKWNTPNYNWEKMKANGFKWWKSRISFMLDHFDIIRLDHFVGMEHVWEIPVADPDGKTGSWQPSLGRDLLNAIVENSPSLPIIAEDLGELSEEVIILRDDFQLPSMRIMQFAFGGGLCNEHLPDNIPENAVVYTGTHDNNTLLGWVEDLQNLKLIDQIDFVKKSLNISDISEVTWPMISLALNTKAHTVVIPLQDIMELSSEARFNTPGTIKDNWQWRFTWDQLNPESLNRLKQLTSKSQRGIASE